MRSSAVLAARVGIVAGAAADDQPHARRSPLAHARVGRRGAELVFFCRDLVAGRLQPDLNERALLVGLRLELAGHAFGLLDRDLGALDGLTLRIDAPCPESCPAPRPAARTEQTTTLANAILPTRRPIDWRIIANPPEDYRNPRPRNSLHEICSEESRHGVELVDDAAPGAARPETAARNPLSGDGDRGRSALRDRGDDGSAVRGPAGAPGSPAAPGTRRTARRRGPGWPRSAPPVTGFAGRRERQLVDDHAAQGLADDVDALPEARGREAARNAASRGSASAAAIAGTLPCTRIG